MKCYAHSAEDAVGICASCGRGLCRNCAADTGKSLACAGRCEERVQALAKLQDASIETLQKARQNSDRVYAVARWMLAGLAAFFLFIGLAFAAFGHGRWDQFWFAAVAGYIFVAFAGLPLIVSMFLPQSQSPEQSGKDKA